MSVGRLRSGQMTAGELQRLMRERQASGRLPPPPRTETPIGDRLDEMTAGNRLATYRQDRHTPEFDPYTQFSRRHLRRLTGAGYLSARGERPDVFADLLWRAGGDGIVGDDAIAWYLREALRALDERQAAARRDRRLRLAANAGHRTEYAYRSAQARAAGFRSFWALRRSRGWS